MGNDKKSATLRRRTLRAPQREQLMADPTLGAVSNKTLRQMHAVETKAKRGEPKRSGVRCVFSNFLQLILRLNFLSWIFFAICSFGSRRQSGGSDPAPQFKQFKNAFENLLEQQDFSKQKQDMLMKMPDDQKWSLMKQYKGSTLDLIVSGLQFTHTCGTSFPIPFLSCLLKALRDET